MPSRSPPEAWGPLLPVPQRKGEHADETLDRGPQPPFGDRLDHDFGIGMAPEPVAERLKLGPELARIIDLAVIGDDVAPAGGTHRLRAGRRQIDDGETGKSKRDAGLGVNEDAPVGRPAMSKPRGHSAGNRLP